MRLWSAVKDLVLALMAVLLSSLAILAIYLQAGVISITSASMAPTLDVGDSAITIQVTRESVRLGDVLVLPHPSEPSIYFAHRVVAVDRTQERVVVQTQGDANPVKDAWSLELRSKEMPRVQFVVATSRLPLNFADRIRVGQAILLVALAAFLLPLLLPGGKGWR